MIVIGQTAPLTFGDTVMSNERLTEMVRPAFPKDQGWFPHENVSIQRFRKHGQFLTSESMSTIKEWTVDGKHLGESMKQTWAEAKVRFMQ